MRVAVIYGTRPEAIKMAPVLRALRAQEEVEVISISSGQHEGLLEPLIELLDLHVDVNLGLMKPGQSIAEFVSRAILAIHEALEEIKPDATLVHGDTSTAFAAAMASFYAGIPIGHVEAGLRTGNLLSPWPEESNRRLISPLAQWNFCPTESNASNLLREGISSETVHITGNTVIDSLLWMRDRLEQSDHGGAYAQRYVEQLDGKKMILVTNHRRENFDGKNLQVYRAIADLAADNDDVAVVFPVHLNPQARRPAEEILGHLGNVSLIEPVDYPEFVYLMSKASLIITDSGGIQEEAPSFGIPVLVTRDTTERPEALQSGLVELVGTDFTSILDRARKLLESGPPVENVQNPYGDGTAGARIAGILAESLPQSGDPNA